MDKSIHSTSHAALCETIKRQRRAMGLTQAELARKLGKSQSFIAKVELGERRLDVHEFVAYARALDLDPLELLKVIL